MRRGGCSSLSTPVPKPPGSEYWRSGNTASSALHQDLPDTLRDEKSKDRMNPKTGTKLSTQREQQLSSEPSERQGELPRLLAAQPPSSRQRRRASSGSKCTEYASSGGARVAPS